MSLRFILPFADVGSGITPSSGAQLFFFETGTSTPKDTYSDVNATTPNANPVISDSNGLFGDIFLVGEYKSVLKDKNGSQIWEADPVAVTESVSFDDISGNGIYTWDPTFNYTEGGYSIGSDDEIYQAITTNMGNDPISSPNDWDILVKDILTPVVSAEALTAGSTLPTRTPVIFSAQNPKDVAMNRNDADIASDDLTAMVGYASHSGVTGGQGATIFWVINESDDILFDGCFRWAVEQVRASGVAGRVLFDTRNEMNITLETQVVLPDNITVDAPGRNVKLWSATDVTRLKIENVNNIIRRLSFGTLPSSSSTTRDAIFVEPSTANKLWIDQNNFKYCGDGCIDIASLSDIVAPCNVTISRNLFRNHDKVMLLGTLACYNPGAPAYCALASAETAQILTTIYKNWFDHTGQRHPKVVTKAFVHSVNNYFHISPKDRDDGSTGANYGILTATGGAVLSQGDLFTSANGSDQEAINSITEDWVEGADGPGISKAEDYVLTDGMTVTEVNPNSVPVPPYTLTPDVITDTAEGRKSFSESIIENAGSNIDSTAKGVFIWNDAYTKRPDGEIVYSVVNSAVGRYVRVSKELTNVQEEKGVNLDGAISTPRGLTNTIVTGVVTFPDTITSSYFAIETEGLAATDDLDTITPILIKELDGDGFHLFLRAASDGRDVVLKHGTGNLSLEGGADITLSENSSTVHLMFDAVLGLWVQVASSLT